MSVSPVWYYIQRRSPMQFDFDGEHDVDLGVGRSQVVVSN